MEHKENEEDQERGRPVGSTSEAPDLVEFSVSSVPLWLVQSSVKQPERRESSLFRVETGFE